MKPRNMMYGKIFFVFFIMLWTVFKLFFSYAAIVYREKSNKKDIKLSRSRIIRVRTVTTLFYIITTLFEQN